MPENTVAISFGELLKCAVSGEEPPGGVHPDWFTPTRAGAEFMIPIERHAVIPSSAFEDRPAQRGTVEWLQGDGDSPVVDAMRLYPTPDTRGKLATAGGLPTPTMQGEFSTAAATSEPTLGDHDYVLDKVIETRSDFTRLAVIQSGEDALDDLVLEACRIAIRDKLAQQALAGDGVGNNMAGVLNVTGIIAGTYVQADRGKDSNFTTGEIAVEDASGRLPFMVWALGKDIDESTRTTAIDPGSSRRVQERGRLSLSGVPVQRVVGELEATTGLLADWRTVILPIADRVQIVTNRIMTPGQVRLTARLACASPIVTVPATVYKLSQV